MPMELNLPSGYGHVNMLFQGAGAPKGAAVTFGVNQVGLTATQVAQAVNDAWNGTLKSSTSTSLQLAGTRAKLGPMDVGPFAFVGSGTAGTRVGPLTSPNVTFLIRKNTGIGGRQGAGRIYWPGVAESDVGEGGVVIAGTVTSMQTAWTAFFTDLGTRLVPMVLLHSHGAYTKLVDGQASVVVVAPKLPTTVTGVTFDSTVATQRRRLRG